MKKISTLLLLLLVGSTAVSADVVEQSFAFDHHQVAALNPAPGTVIGKDNVTSFSHILAPKLADLISAELLTVTTGEPVSIATHPAYIEATRRYLGRTELGDEPGIIHHYVGGRPFPAAPQPDDPRAGDKLAWNLRYTYSYDSGEIANFYWQYRTMRHDKIERQLSFYAASLRFMHRHVQEPVPSMPNNPSAIYHSLYLRVLAPPDLRGTQLLVQRLEDDTRPEQVWLYLSGQRRVRRLASGQTTDSFLGSDIMIEDFLGYNGRIMDQKWTYKGVTHVLLPFFHHDRQQLEEVGQQPDGFRFVGFHGKGGCFPNVTWHVRKAYILEAEPYWQQHPLSKRRYYLDAQTMLPVYGHIFDRPGELWKVAIAAYSHPDSHHPANHGMGVPIIDAVSMVDIQAQHCTTLQFKAILPEKPFKETDFTVQALRAKGR
ncbi:MAG: DUF1329 domain-containing protein [Gammaproteobacteria bacterium]|nr:DUF1329 domain-containing protein [Gammaproteobacteria bacterium]